MDAEGEDTQAWTLLGSDLVVTLPAASSPFQFRLNRMRHLKGRASPGPAGFSLSVQITLSYVNGNAPTQETRQGQEIHAQTKGHASSA